MPKRVRAFTLVEIMIVVSIIGILLMIAIPAWRKVRETSKTKACFDNMRIIRDGKLQWGMDNNKSVTDIPSEADLTPEYIKSMPKCQEGGTYIYNTVGDHVECSVHGQVP